MYLSLVLILIFLITLVLRGHFSLKSSKNLLKSKNISFPPNFNPIEKIHGVNIKGKIYSTLYIDTSNKKLFYVYNPPNTKITSSKLLNFNNIKSCEYINDSLSEIDPKTKNMFIKKLGLKLKLKNCDLNEIELFLVNDNAYVGRSEFYSNYLLKTSKEYYNLLKKVK